MCRVPVTDPADDEGDEGAGAQGEAHQDRAGRRGCTHAFTFD